jgi:ATPase subunit of ABC transporter with duplicated ATPase domains
MGRVHKRWLEDRLRESAKTVLVVSHDRELLRRCADRIATLERGAAGASVWVHGGSFASYGQPRLEELRRRWDEDHARLRALVGTLKQKATYNDGMASRYEAALTRLAKFEAAGPPQSVPVQQRVRMRLRGGRTGKRAVVCEQLELTGLMRPFDLDVWYGERVAVLGSNGSGKSHFLHLLAGDDVAHTGTVRLGARVLAGLFAQTHAHPELLGRTLLEILHRGTEDRAGMGREPASRALDRYDP